jgi:hypothetical protein
MEPRPDSSLGHPRHLSDRLRFQTLTVFQDQNRAIKLWKLGKCHEHLSPPLGFENGLLGVHACRSQVAFELRQLAIGQHGVEQIVERLGSSATMQHPAFVGHYAMQPGSQRGLPSEITQVGCSSQQSTLGDVLGVLAMPTQVGSQALEILAIAPHGNLHSRGRITRPSVARPSVARRRAASILARLGKGHPDVQPRRAIRGRSIHIRTLLWRWGSYNAWVT